MDEAEYRREKARYRLEIVDGLARALDRWSEVDAAVSTSADRVEAVRKEAAHLRRLMNGED